VDFVKFEFNDLYTLLYTKNDSERRRSVSLAYLIIRTTTISHNNDNIIYIALLLNS